MTGLDEVLRRVLPGAPVGWEPTTLRCAAVLLPLFARPDGEHVLFTVRPAHLPSHGGQISFPGGAREGGESPVQCALRETAEELGLDGSRVVLLGGLPARQSTSGFRVHAVVGRIPDPAVLVPDSREVERLLTIPLAQLQVPGAFVERAPEQPGGGRYPPSPHFTWGDDVVWGLTGCILRDFVSVLSETG